MIRPAQRINPHSIDEVPIKHIPMFEAQDARIKDDH